MVNLKQFLTTTTNSETDFTRNFETLFRYVRKSDAEFFSKILKAANDIFQDKTIPQINKYFCLHFINLCVQCQMLLFNEYFEKELSRGLLSIALTDPANYDFEKKDKNFFKKDNSTSEDEYSIGFFQLLIECIEFWYANNKTSCKVFETMYLEAEKNRVVFIENPKHILKYFALLETKSQKSEENNPFVEKGRKDSNSTSFPKFPNNYAQKSEAHLKQEVNEFGDGKSKWELNHNFIETKPNELKKVIETFIKSSEDLKYYLQTNSEADEKLNNHFAQLNSSVQQLLIYENDIKGSQKQYLNDGIHFLSCYDEANDYETLRETILQYINERPIELTPPKFNQYKNDLTQSQELLLRASVDKSVKLSRSIEKRSDDLDRSKEKQQKKTSDKHYSQSTETPNSENEPKNNKQFAEKHENNKNGVMKEEKKRELHGTTSRQSIDSKKKEPYHLNDQVFKRTYIEFIDHERKRLKEKITELEKETYNLKNENRKINEKCHELEDKLSTQVSTTKELQISLKKNEEIIEKFVRKSKFFIENEFFKEGRVDPEQKLLQRSKDDKMKSIESIMKKSALYSSPQNFENEEPISPIPAFQKNSNYYFNEEPYNVQNYQNYKNLPKEAPRTPIGNSNNNNGSSYSPAQVHQFKDSIKANEDFVTGFNDEISNLLNRKKETYQPLNLNKKTGDYPKFQSKSAVPPQFSESLTAENSTISTFPRFSVPDNFDKSNQNIYDTFLEKYRQDKSIHVSEKNIGRVTEGHYIPSYTVQHKDSNTVLRDHFFGNPNEQILNGIMKFKR